MGEETCIVLLRGINVGGHNKIPMAGLSSLCSEIGWTDVQTYIQSGNLVMKSASGPGEIEARLEREIERVFGLTISVIARAGADWPAYVEGNPFPDASEKEPKLVMLCLPKSRPKQGAVEELQKRAANEERLALVGDGLWVHYSGGVVAKSKLSPALVDRIVGSPVTARNWRTVLKLNEMARNT